MVVAITTQTQDVYPPRVLVALTGLTVGDDVEIYRVVGGIRTLVRAASAETTDTSFLRVDAELPFGVPVTYVGVVNDSTEVSAGPTTYVLDSGKPVLTDAITGAAAEAIIRAEDPRRYSRESSVFVVGGRNVVVAGPVGQYSSSLELFTESTTGLNNLLQLLQGATQGIIQIRNALGDRSDYVSVQSFETRRFSQDRTDERRYVVLDFVEVDGWASNLEATGYTYGDVAAFYSTGTYGDAMADYPTYLAAVLGDYS